MRPRLLAAATISEIYFGIWDTSEGKKERETRIAKFRAKFGKRILL